MTESYRKKEMDLMFDRIDTKVETYHREVMIELKAHADVHEQLLNQAKFTNGKVKKIIIALVFLSGFCLGLGILEVNTVLKALAI